MGGSHLEMASVLRDAAGDPYRMLLLRHLARSSMCLTGTEQDEELLAALAEAASLGRLMPEGLWHDAHTGSWVPLEAGSADGVDEDDDATPAPARRDPDLDLDQDLQAATLVNAALDGTPFCEKCERSRTAEAVGA